MLTGKDHIKIVKIFNNRPVGLSDEREKGKAEMKTVLVADFSKWLKEDNPDFDEDKFIEAVHIL